MLENLDDALLCATTLFLGLSFSFRVEYLRNQSYLKGSVLWVRIRTVKTDQELFRWTDPESEPNYLTI
jgi:hypothetical protein